MNTLLGGTCEMESKLRFSKQNTLAVKGLAIVFLLTYHCFSSTSRLYGHTVSFWPLSQDTVITISRSMTHCVGLFVFLSVYGLTLSMKKQYEHLQFTGQEAALFVLKRYVGLVFTFLLPFFFCAGITLALGMSRYSNGFWANITSVLMDMLGLGHLFDTQPLISTWWYLSLEVLVIVFMPLAVRFYKKYSWLTIAMVLLPGSFLLEKHVHLTKYLFVVPIAVCFADRQVLERLKAYAPLKNSSLNKLLKFVVTTGLIVIMCLLFDSQWGIQHFEFALHGLIPTALVYWSYEFLVDLPLINPFLEFLGKRSADIFYTHTFVRAMWLKDVTYSLGHALVIWLFVLAVSIAISYILDGLKKILHYKEITGKAMDKMMQWAEKTL